MLKSIKDRIILSVVLSGLFILCSIPLASAEAANFSGMSPANGGSVTSGTLDIRVNVTDTVDLDKDSLTVSVNGKSEPTSFNFKEIGYYENEDYQEGWVVTGYVYTQAFITIKPANLADGPTQVTVSVKNINGVTSDITWSFDVKQPPVISDIKPWYNTIVGPTTTISAKVTDNGPISQVRMTVKGVEVPAVFDPIAGTVSYIPLNLTSGSYYPVVLTVTDSIGLTKSQSWSFLSEYYQDSQVTGLCRDCHSGSSGFRHPMNNCDLCHARGPVGDYASCLDCHNPPHGEVDYYLLNYNCTSCHRLQYPEIPSHPADNITLHNTTTNMGECQKCHQVSLTTEHLRRQDANGNALNCQTCHNSTIPAVQQAISSQQKNCEACHSQANHDTLHVNSVLDDKCKTCHINNLSGEHLSNSITQINGLSCATCHENNDPYITGAINAGDQICAACHSEGHNMVFAEKVPADIPLYPGFEWSLPVKATIFAEPWMPSKYAAVGKLVISNRSTYITGDQIWTFYQNEMADNGWTVASGTPAAGSDNYMVEFTKDTRQVGLWFYGGVIPGTSQPESGGYRMQIIYK